MDDKRKRMFIGASFFSLGQELIIQEEKCIFLRGLSDNKPQTVVFFLCFFAKTEINLVFLSKDSILDDETL